MRLYFKEGYADPILRGDKRSTFRDRPNASVGEVVTAATRRRGGFARLRITEVEQLRVDQITEAMARANDFPNAAAQRERLAKTYPGTEVVWRIAFERVVD